jgi:hypothetical protein
MERFDTASEAVQWVEAGGPGVAIRLAEPAKIYRSGGSQTIKPGCYVVSNDLAQMMDCAGLDMAYLFVTDDNILMSVPTK